MPIAANYSTAYFAADTDLADMSAAAADTDLAGMSAVVADIDSTGMSVVAADTDLFPSPDLLVSHIHYSLSLHQGCYFHIEYNTYFPPFSPREFSLVRLSITCFCCLYY